MSGFLRFCWTLILHFFIIIIILFLSPPYGEFRPHHRVFINLLVGSSSCCYCRHTKFCYSLDDDASQKCLDIHVAVVVSWVALQRRRIRIAIMAS
jgi:hypothetical protein